MYFKYIYIICFFVIDKLVEGHLKVAVEMSRAERSEANVWKALWIYR